MSQVKEKQKYAFGRGLRKGRSAARVLTGYEQLTGGQVHSTSQHQYISQVCMWVHVEAVAQLRKALDAKSLPYPPLLATSQHSLTHLLADVNCLWRSQA